MRVARPIVLDETTRKELQRQARGRSVSVRIALRSRIVLLAAEGLQNLQIGAELNISVRMAALWRKRFGKAMIMSVETETSEIIRRRLFEWNGLVPNAHYRLARCRAPNGRRRPVQRTVTSCAGPST